MSGAGLAAVGLDTPHLGTDLLQMAAVLSTFAVICSGEAKLAS